MEERLKYARVAPRGYRAMVALQDYVDDCGSGAFAARAGQDACLADQWLFILHRHA